LSCPAVRRVTFLTAPIDGTPGRWLTVTLLTRGGCDCCHVRRVAASGYDPRIAKASPQARPYAVLDCIPNLSPMAVMPSPTPSWTRAPSSTEQPHQQAACSIGLRWCYQFPGNGLNVPAPPQPVGDVAALAE